MEERLCAQIQHVQKVGLDAARSDTLYISVFVPGRKHQLIRGIQHNRHAANAVCFTGHITHKPDFGVGDGTVEGQLQRTRDMTGAGNGSGKCCGAVVAITQLISVYGVITLALIGAAGLQCQRCGRRKIPWSVAQKAGRDFQPADLV